MPRPKPGDRKGTHDGRSDMSKVEEVQKRQAAELEKAHREDCIAAVLPLPARSICVHNDYSSVTYGAETWEEAKAIYQRFADEERIRPAEHWKLSCLSVLPAELNQYAKDERAHMDGESWAEVSIEAFGGELVPHYRTAKLKFFANVKSHWLSVTIEIAQVPWVWMPSQRIHGGRVVRGSTVPKFIGEDQRRKWSGEEPGYHFSYYWADQPNFESWAANGPYGAN